MSGRHDNEQSKLVSETQSFRKNNWNSRFLIALLLRSLESWQKLGD